MTIFRTFPACILIAIAYGLAGDGILLNTDDESGVAPVTESPAGIDNEPSELDWSVVRDRVEIQGEEYDHYYYLLNLANETNLVELRSEAEAFRRERWAIEGEPKGRSIDRFPSFVDVMLHPEAYRGKPITLRGHTQDILVSQAGENTYGIETLYEAWLYTPDSQQIPTIVICTEIPEGLETGRQLIDGVSVTGYFLKHRAYEAQDGKLHFAPLILAHRLEWNSTNSTTSLPNWLIGLGGAGIMLLVGWVWWTFRSDREFNRKRLAADAAPVDLSKLPFDE